MNVIRACSEILTHLKSIIDQISETDFSKPSIALSGSSIGQHLRHTIEFFICFQTGYSNGIINYDKRAHDKLIENDKFTALAALSDIDNFVTTLSANKSLQLEVGYDIEKESYIKVDTNAFRELVYNIEHAVHHMAIMKIGIREVAPYISLPENFGIAASTLRHKEKDIHQVTHS